MLRTVTAALLATVLTAGLTACSAPPMARVTWPADGQVVDGPDVGVRVATSNWDLAEAPGPHVHVIVDNMPYRAYRSNDEEPMVFEGLAPGTHSIRVFPSSAVHISEKNPEAFQLIHFHVGERTATHVIDPDKPFITYSRPKGEYEGEAADAILVDFWVNNCTLAQGGHHVRLTVDGDSRLITQWPPAEPLYITGLEPGDHEFKLELIGPDGRLVDNAYTRTVRTITVR